jgi:hypothetical protein
MNAPFDFLTYLDASVVTQDPIHIDSGAQLREKMRPTKAGRRQTLTADTVLRENDECIDSKSAGGRLLCSN